MSKIILHRIALKNGKDSLPYDELSALNIWSQCNA